MVPWRGANHNLRLRYVADEFADKTGLADSGFAAEKDDRVGRARRVEDLNQASSSSVRPMKADEVIRPGTSVSIPATPTIDH
jgi:hypothetical protein